MSERMILLDKDIREPLFDDLERRFKTIRILEEKEIGQSRADVVMVCKDALYGIEIKSDADTYARLKRQVKDYDRYYDRNFIVVGSTHAASAAEHVPSWWGILSAEWTQEHMDLYLIRDAKDNPKRETDAQLSLLWRPELVRIQEMYNMAAYKQKSKAFVQQKILETVEEEELRQRIRDALFERDYTLIKEQINAYRKENGRRARRRPPRRKKKKRSV